MINIVIWCLFILLKLVNLMVVFLFVIYGILFLNFFVELFMVVDGVVVVFMLYVMNRMRNVLLVY